MPFLIPLIPVIAGGAAFAATTAGMLAIGSAVVGGLGYIAKDKDLMKIGGLLGIASLGVGLAGGAAAAEGAAAEGAVSGGEELYGPSNVEITGEVDGTMGPPNVETVDPNVVVEGGTGTESYASPTNPLGATVDDTAGILGPEMPSDVPVDGEFDLSGKLAGDSTKSLSGNASADIANTDQDQAFRVPKTSDPADTLFDQLRNKWNNLGDKEKAAWLQLGGSALSGLTPDQRAEAYKKQLEFEMMKYRERLKNMNNVGYINLSMNPNQAPKPY